MFKEEVVTTFNEDVLSECEIDDGELQIADVLLGGIQFFRLVVLDFDSVVSACIFTDDGDKELLTTSTSEDIFKSFLTTDDGGAIVLLTPTAPFLITFR